MCLALTDAKKISLIRGLAKLPAAPPGFDRPYSEAHHKTMSAPSPAFSFPRLAGAALGAMCGDALGMPMEGLSPEAIAARFGRPDRMLEGRLPAGSYTDDSQMMLAILKTLSVQGRLDPVYLAARFVAMFDPRRGYGGRIQGVMQRLADGEAWDRAGTDSFGNGGAMRVGVLGAFYPDDENGLLAAALDQCLITHYHPEALAGAGAQALAVALACRWGAAGWERDAVDAALYLADKVRHLDEHTADRLDLLAGLPMGDQDAAARFLINEYARNVTAAEAVRRRRWGPFWPRTAPGGPSAWRSA